LFRRFCLIALGAGFIDPISALAGPLPHDDLEQPAHTLVVRDDSISALGPWGSARQVISVDEFFFSGQPDAAGFAQAAAQGVSVVINIRGPREVGWDVAGAAQGAGLKYYNEPLLVNASGLDSDSIGRINDLIAQHDGERILVHCASGNRVAAWWATHLVEAHRMNADAAVTLARKAGLTSSSLAVRVREQFR